MNSSEYHDLLQEGSRRTLLPDEIERIESFLKQHPAMIAEWELETSLNAALRNLRPAPLSSNFTSQVIRAVEKGSPRKLEASFWRSWRRVFLPRLAIASVLVGIAFLSYRHHELTLRRELAQTVADVSSITILPAVAKAPSAAAGASVPSIEMLVNFEEIQSLNQIPYVDDELLAALQ